jgi:hypothetical protein
LYLKVLHFHTKTYSFFSTTIPNLQYLTHLVVQWCMVINIEACTEMKCLLIKTVFIHSISFILNPITKSHPIKSAMVLCLGMVMFKMKICITFLAVCCCQFHDSCMFGASLCLPASCIFVYNAHWLQFVWL